MSSKSRLSREGFTADVFGKWLQATVFDASKTNPLLLLAHYTSTGREAAASHPQAIKALKAIALLGVVRRLNAWLNRRALNNGVCDTYNWNRELVVLTGGSNGIGKQIALKLAERDIKCAILDISPPTYDLPPSLRYYECDITSPEAISTVASQIRAAFGGGTSATAPTILINNAGICTGKTILTSTERDTRRTFDVNALAHYWLAREFLPAMIDANHGMVVTVASQCGFVTTANMVDYSATKAAAVSFHEGLTTELVTRYHAPKVRTVLVTQGFTRTALIKDLTPEDTWFNPLLYPETVAEEVVKCVLKGESGCVLVPGSGGWVARNLRGMPYWMQYGMRNRLEKLFRTGN